MNALKDKHGVDDDAVMVDIITRIKAQGGVKNSGAD